MQLTYRFKNDEKNLDIKKQEYIVPKEITFYTKSDDEVYVSDGEEVYINQLLKESKSGIKTYATVSGTAEVKKGLIRIINDSEDSTIISEDTVDDISKLKKDEILSILSDLGIEYENKLIVDQLKGKNKVIIINGMDIEPYQFNNNYMLEDRLENILEVTEVISNIFNLSAYLLLNKYDENNIEAARKVISKYPNIIFKTIDEEFPFTSNPCLAKKYFKEYKYNELLFFDAFALNKIYTALKDGLPVSERYITVCLNGTEKIYVVKCRYGTSLGRILEEAVSIDLTNRDVYLNNYMRRVICDNVKALIVNDNVKTIFVLDHEDIKTSKCIKCGKCVEICPVNINPLDKKLDPSCIRCGLCNNVCPANINLLNKEK